MKMSLISLIIVSFKSKAFTPPHHPLRMLISRVGGGTIDLKKSIYRVGVVCQFRHPLKMIKVMK